ncbi:very-long-chain 3-oxoacyl-CoA reductase-B-like [Oppia nitens]|uniref:very-long-chain 3-oxoacyl-CoA reductase-B-like n=1 Tax=Oppia nitens TaxID=1686743 RepID=UPI0023DC6B9F|nr:very-long-chain 3-oxoacyl-CoA reductase-B-like [Oppia nitens]
MEINVTISTVPAIISSSDQQTVTINLTTVPLILLLLLSLLTLVIVLLLLWKLPQLVWTYLLAYYMGAGVRWQGNRPDTWAVITGATDGIGLAYAKAMARKGYSLVLMSRSLDKLESVKSEIHKLYVQCPRIKLIQIDFSADDNDNEDNLYDSIGEELAGKLHQKIHVLINNVGMTYRYPEYFTRLANRREFERQILNVNCRSMTRLIGLVLPGMVANRSGIILNVCSYSACFPTPLLALYSASKIYGDYLSRALNAEYRSRGIVIQSVLPYYVSTNMIRNPPRSFMIPSSDQFVESALKTVGIESRTFGYLPHTVVAFCQNFLLKFLIGNDINMRLAFRKMRLFRHQYLAKRDKYAKDNGVGIGAGDGDAGHHHQPNGNGLVVDSKVGNDGGGGGIDNSAYLADSQPTTTTMYGTVNTTDKANGGPKSLDPIYDTMDSIIDIRL